MNQIKSAISKGDIFFSTSGAEGNRDQLGGHGGTWSDMPRSTKRVLAVGVTMCLG